MELDRNKFKIIIAKTLGISPDKIEMDRGFSSYGVDSVKIMEVYMELETEFGAIEIEKAFVCENLEQIFQLINDR